MKIFKVIFLLSSFIVFGQEKLAIDRLYPTQELVIKQHDDWGAGNYKKVIEEFKSNPLNYDDIVFLGNSITAGGKDWSKRLNYPNIRNRGIGGDVTNGVLARTDEITYFKPKAVFLLIGINDLWNNNDTYSSSEYIANNIKKIAQIINVQTPKTKIYIQTVLPTDKEKHKNNILKINEIIKANEKENPYQIIDLYSIFVNENGLIKSGLSTDGIHLNEKGYDTWVEFIKPIVYSLDL
ncbi:GDSL-type esterase/lipase family protein [Flavobacteriaceae bacterium]|nr:GDSL-type esterase/lipase family protein [Flavobacteriaceae bacterium]|tara:strand:- start:331 stop:1041 length:711 start_codon:yes stop_codon:yes gene_type:complete